EARAAVAIEPPGGLPQSFGVIWITARTDVDKERGSVSLEDVKIPKVNFPAATPQKNADFLRVAQTHVPVGVSTLPLDQFEASLAITDAAKKSKAVAVNNDPPRIIVSTDPALLVRIDGTPVLRQLPGSALMRVINTRALILLDPSTGRYYLHVLNGWAEAPAAEGPWTAAGNPPASLEQARQAAGPAVDLLDDARPGHEAGGLPVIYVSARPAELFETDGQPEWSPIQGTNLLYAKNTSAHVFLELKTQYTYVLVSGRWFRARSTAGPWEYVPGAQLPPDFARIPESDPASAVLASVPNTPQAREALIANTIPQTATVNRSEARFTATYDGQPRFVPVAATPLLYAVNSPTPVIRVDARTYYALYNGVWFVSTAPLGPWVVAAVVPGVIYTIPVSSPLHYVTYVRVYGYTPAVVYVGYTPGYFGTVATPDGVVVYGTGIAYTPWVGTVWYPPPPTYGAGAAFAWGAATGFVVGAVTTAAVWGCCATSTSTVNVNVNRTTTTVNGSNVYGSWSKTTVTSGSESATAYRGPNSAVVTNNQNNNVYASHDGDVYKKQDGSWEKWNGSGQGWQPVNTSSKPPTSTTAAPGGSQPVSSSAASPQASAPSAQSSNPGQRGPGQPGAAQGQRSEEQIGQSQGQRSEAQANPAGQGPGVQRPGAAGSAPGGMAQQGARSSGGLFDGLNRESVARARGAERFNGARLGGGFFRR
ncbi:MAG TPA: hypothetical protein VEL75_15655, partial [Candidatus Methylomirabilis sp.]|nr:hypothetical protein [Candidatus Methylomirabilis sp.]